MCQDSDQVLVPRVYYSQFVNYLFIAAQINERMIPFRFRRQKVGVSIIAEYHMAKTKEIPSYEENHLLYNQMQVNKINKSWDIELNAVTKLNNPINLFENKEFQQVIIDEIPVLPKLQYFLAKCLFNRKKFYNYHQVPSFQIPMARLTMRIAIRMTPLQLFYLNLKISFKNYNLRKVTKDQIHQLLTQRQLDKLSQQSFQLPLSIQLNEHKQPSSVLLEFNKDLYMSQQNLTIFICILIKYYLNYISRIQVPEFKNKKKKYPSKLISQNFMMKQ
ncbi:hypothetical protein ABPG72_002591 [Tetrahymena utriculariae]